MEHGGGLLQTATIGEQTALGEGGLSGIWAPNVKGFIGQNQPLKLGMETDREPV